MKLPLKILTLKKLNTRIFLSDEVVGTAFTNNADPSLYYTRDIRWLTTSRKQPNKTYKVRKKILLVQRNPPNERFKVSHVLCKILDGYRLPYEVTRVDEKSFIDLKNSLRSNVFTAKYALVIFVDIRTYVDLKDKAKEILNSYSRKFNTGILFFATNYVGYIREFELDIRKPAKEKGPLFIKVNGSSSLLRITRDGGRAEKPRVPKGLGTRWMLLSYDPVRTPLEVVSYVLPGQSYTKKARRSIVRPEFNRATVVLDNGKRDGVKRVFFSGGFPFFLHTLLFLDAMDYLSPMTLTFSLDRYLQIDVDDVFIGSTGLRLHREDVMVSRVICHVTLHANHFLANGCHCQHNEMYICLFYYLSTINKLNFS